MSGLRQKWPRTLALGLGLSTALALSSAVVVLTGPRACGPMILIDSATGIGHLSPCVGEMAFREHLSFALIVLALVGLAASSLSFFLHRNRTHVEKAA